MEGVGCGTAVRSGTAQLRGACKVSSQLSFLESFRSPTSPPHRTGIRPLHFPTSGEHLKRGQFLKLQLGLLLLLEAHVAFLPGVLRLGLWQTRSF